jgi:uncharacterized protein (TIGR04141 family)
LTAPIVVDDQNIAGYRYPRERNNSELHTELRMADYLARLGQGAARIVVTIDFLKTQLIRMFDGVAEAPTRKFSVYDAIVFEVSRGQKLFVLTRGDWFEVDEQHVDRVQGYIAGIPESDIVVPPAMRGEREGPYNTRASNESGGLLALLDKQMIQYGGRHSKIELCDLLSNSREFLHVKISTQSSLLSHLFNQGVVSAQLLRHQDFRTAAKQKCPASHASLLDLVEPAECSVTFGIITTAGSSLADALPFFSKQSLANAANVLRGIGYQVKLRKIGVV